MAANREWISWSSARAEMNRQLEAAGKPTISRQFLTSRLVPLMEEAGDAARGAKDTLVRADSVDRWAYYLVYRVSKIEAGEWSQIRAYQMDDVLEADAARVAGLPATAPAADAPSQSSG